MLPVPIVLCLADDYDHYLQFVYYFQWYGNSVDMGLMYNVCAHVHLPPRAIGHGYDLGRLDCSYRNLLEMSIKDGRSRTSSYHCFRLS